MSRNRECIDRLYLYMNRIDGLYYMASRKMGVKDNTLLLFYVLNDGRAHSQKEICEEWLIPRTTINTVVKEAVKEDYIRLETSDHTREKKIILTDSGRVYARRLLGRILDAEEHAMERALQEFSPGFLEDLERLTELMQEEFRKEIFDREEEKSGELPD